MNHVATLSASSQSPGVRVLHWAGEFRYEEGSALTLSQVLMLDAAGALDWVSPETAEWARTQVSPPASAPIDEGRASGFLEALPRWAKVVGVMLALGVLGGACTTCITLITLTSQTPTTYEDSREPTASVGAAATDATATQNTVPATESETEPATDPEPHAFAADESAYTERVNDISNATADAITELNWILSTDPDGVMSGGASWAEVAAYGAFVKGMHDEAQALTPPHSMAKLHTEWLAGMQDYSESIDHLAAGIDARDEAEIRRAESLMNSGGQKLEAAIEAMRDLQRD